MRTADLGAIVLDAGAHKGPEDGMCLMEAVAWIVGEPWSDSPACVSVVLARVGRGLNDTLPGPLRQRLVPLIPALIGTSDDGLDETRGYLALDWMVRTWTPTWLEAAGLSAHASALRGLPQIVDVATAEAAGPVVHASHRTLAVVAGAPAGDGAWIVVRKSAGAVAWAAVRCSVARDVGDRTVEPAWDAAMGAASATDQDARATTVTQLQESALDLFARMIRPGGDA